MKKAILIALLVGLVLAVSAYGARTRTSGPPSIEKQAALYQIERIEKTWHKAASTKNLDLMMSIWAQNATMTIGGSTVTGKVAIREVFAKAGPFQPQNNWVSDTPEYKIRATVNGNRGTLYFECHYVDVDTQKVASVVAADQQVQKINGKWLITNSVTATTTLKP
jgi:SnoaL-like domain